MEKLKTLEDIKCEYDIEAKDGENIQKEELKSMQELADETFINKSTIKKELGIKWIIELRKTITYPYGLDIPILDGTNELSKFNNSEKLLKHIFNIKEEDLK